MDREAWQMTRGCKSQTQFSNKTTIMWASSAGREEAGFLNPWKMLPVCVGAGERENEVKWEHMVED